MNNGAFGENFPYSNFHDLNTDWIIKIAKDFLDQYTSIQEVIANGEESITNLTTEGLEQLQTKADDLEALLQQWYETHSEDIANQLADALADIQTTLENTISTFSSTANTIAQNTIASIPADYTTLANKVSIIETDIMNYNTVDVLMPYKLAATSNSRNGISYNWNNGKCTIVGTATAASFSEFANVSPASLGLEPETDYQVIYDQTAKAALAIYSVVGGSYTNISPAGGHSGFFRFPATTETLAFRFTVSTAVGAVNETVDPVVLNKPEVFNAVENRGITGLEANYYASYNIQSTPMSLADVPQNSVCFILASDIATADATDLPVSVMGACYLYKTGRGNFNHYELIENASGRTFHGFKIGNTIRWRALPSTITQRIALMGDSVIWGRIGGVSPVTQTDRGIPYWVSLQTGLVVDNLGVGSMGWISTQYLEYNAEEYVTTIDWTLYKTVGIMLGANDGRAYLGSYTDTTQQTIMGAAYRVIQYICEHNPNCTIVLINHLIGKGSAFPYFNPDDPHYTGWTWNQYYEEMHKFADKYALPVIDAWRAINSWNRGVMIGDNIHPTEAGYEATGKYIAGQMMSII